MAGRRRLPATMQRTLSECLGDWLVEAGLSAVRPSVFFEYTVPERGE